ncbi:MAG TPA: polymer-forming cytoskeletal protein [Burkholderiaceae bacterium]|nr:polymer-forming cytoskeletal protein [Burkholderiaceae bacterium]
MSAKPWFNTQRDASTASTHPDVTPTRTTASAMHTATTPAASTNAATTASTPQQTASGATNNNSSSQLTVGPHIKLTGAQIEQCDALVIEGHVKATIRSGSLRISSTGTFEGDAQVETAEIEGVYTGELNATAKLIVRATGRISGTIRYGKLIVEEGGELGGDVLPIDNKLANTKSSQSNNKGVNAPRETNLQPA